MFVLGLGAKTLHFLIFHLFHIYHVSHSWHETKIYLKLKTSESKHMQVLNNSK